MNELFDRLVDEYGVETKHFCSGVIPIGPPDSATIDLLIGDAAAQTKPFTGGGTLYGMTAADLAAKTIDPTTLETLTDTFDVWRDERATEIRL
ncbi:hypothetical protein JCM17823_10990 [Halorubrum gandharaense]